MLRIDPDKARVHWQVRIKHAGEAKIVDGFLAAPGEWSPVYTLKVQPPREPEPGSPTDALEERLTREAHRRTAAFIRSPRLPRRKLDRLPSPLPLHSFSSALIRSAAVLAAGVPA